MRVLKSEQGHLDIDGHENDDLELDYLSRKQKGHTTHTYIEEKRK